MDNKTVTVENKIEKKIELKAPIAKVWKALSDYKEFGQWFRVNIEAPFAVGEVSSGNMTYPGYEHVKWHAVIRAMEPEKLFSFTWHPYAIDPKVDYSGETPTVIEFILEETKDGTLLTVTETGFDKIPKNRQIDAFRMNSQGWAEQLKNIEKHVTGA